MKQKIHHNKIGARCLTEAEAQMILPTYDQIWNQIEQFRLEKEDKNISQNQKTNNIGIIGVRGAGKTSLLKTIRARLEKDNLAKDVPDLIFPIIVPENMSESSTLMASILGMLKEFVDARVRKEEAGKRNEYCKRESSCRKSYDEVIKQYTYIQKEYRNIMIQEYTTDTDYVKSSTKIFNSDVEFQNKFNDLIRMLVQGSDKAMIILFIDDIDLSTYRCADVVKTLLSYLSNENIITFISGDLETFEEALTLDFLRQEGVLEETMMDKSMLAGVDASSVLESKKKLSYEYLKKILPPAYRHNIKMWDLEKKGDYCILNAESDNTQNRLFSKCLTEALKGWVDPAFFQYMDAWNGKGITEALPYTYHLFDNTSRGLNNVYNVLNDIIDKRKQENVSKQELIVEKKQLLDTIISSTHIYNQYRQQIQGKMFFADAVRSEVSFENALAVIYPETKEEKDYPIQKPVERFTLFIFVDFAARILYEAEYGKRTSEDSDYQKLKKKAMKDLLRYPEIAGKVRTIEIDPAVWEKKDGNTNNNTTANTNSFNLSDLSTGFLTKGDLLFNLAFYKGLSLELVQMLYPYPNDTDRKAGHTAEQEQEVFLAFEKAVHSIAGIKGKESAELLAEGYYAVFWQEFRFIQNSLSSLSRQNEMIRLFSEECADIQSDNLKYLRRIILNTIAEVIPDHEQNRILDNEERNTAQEKKDVGTAKQIIRIIDHKGLWQELAAEHVIKYLKDNITKSIKEIPSLVEKEPEKINIDLTNALEDWDKFYQSYDGVTFTKAAKTKLDIVNLLKGAVYKDEKSYTLETEETIEQVKKKGVDYQTFCEIMKTAEKLVGNYRVWYGRVEAQELQNGMMKCFIKIDKLKENHPGYNDFVFCLNYYYKYKIACGDKDQIQLQAKLLKELSESISIAHQTADKKVLDNFIDQLNEDLKDEAKIDSKKFKELFESKK